MYEHTNKQYILGIDIGGSHITAALVDDSSGLIAEQTITRKRIDAAADSETILFGWMAALHQTIATIPGALLSGIGIAMPGPFNYEEGICLMRGVNKYDALYNVDVLKFIRKQFDLAQTFPVKFENDACCFGLGESISAELQPFENVMAITLGTGFGATFIKNQLIKKEGKGIPANGELYNFPYLDGIAEDYISAAWMLKKYNSLTGNRVTEVAHIAALALDKQDANALIVFEGFGNHLATCLLPWIKSFKAHCLVIGGSIAKSSTLFIAPLKKALSNEGIQLEIKISILMELSAITGAAYLTKQNEKEKLADGSLWRKTSQPLLPFNSAGTINETGYNMYPFHKIGTGDIYTGYDSMAEWMATKKTVMIDGFGGNDWTEIQAKLATYFTKNNISVRWFETINFQKPEAEINKLVKPFLGEEDAVWGTRATLSLQDFYDAEKLTNLQPDAAHSLNIIIGTGAAFAGWASLIYVDLPKNEIQYRMRAGSTTNLCSGQLIAPATMYKRFYFVDWIVLSKHRRQVTDTIDLIADGQWKDDISWCYAATVKRALLNMSTDVIRARPWFEAGTWGGNWMKENIPQINKKEINYAWSFELIAPENGIVLESNNNLLEISFDWLMELQTLAVLGKDAKRFGTEFPIRFDFLDTFDGGNLSIQCHPSLQYIQDNFGENITQDETYYILDCKDNAKVYLGFQDDINAADFKKELNASVEENRAIDIDRYVQSFEARKHDLFLIPNKTIHSAGKDNMVLEISATPYIFTFKMYDWVRLDLEGNPRPINIDHAFNNLDFTRKGASVKEGLISKQTMLENHNDWQVVNLSTHADHFYAVHRLEFSTTMQCHTNNQCHVMMLVEGESITIKTRDGSPTRFYYAETFIIPAAANGYEIINHGKTQAKVIQAFIK